MSNLINVQFEVRSIAIMRDTLTQMGLSHTEQDEILTISRSRYPIAINTKTGQISYDSDQTQEVNKIKQNYQVNFYRDRAIKEGMSVTQEVNAKGEIELYLTNN